MKLQKVMRKYYDEYSEEVIQEFKDNGVNVYELSEDEKAQWNKFYGEIEERLGKRTKRS